MKKSGRKLMMVANWKMNKTTTEATAFLEDLTLSMGRQLDVNIVICPPFTALESAGKILEGTHIALGAQNMHAEREGAFTGEISAEMLRYLFVSYVILGHSERRFYNGETNALINQKLHTAFESKLRPILCIGETASERAAGNTLSVLKTQLHEGLKDITEKQADTLVIAYEPVWAIGTGNTATPDIAQEAHAAIREILSECISPAAAQRTRILYGGSMKAENVTALLEEPDIDGGLVGSAALEVRSFIKLVESAQSITA